MVHAHPGVRGPHPSRRPDRPTTPVVRLVARTLSGLEHLTAHQITVTNLGTVDSIGHREVLFTSPCPHRVRRDLRTADDVYHLLATVSGIDHRRAALATLREALAAADLAIARPAGNRGRGDYSVTASFTGRRNYTRFDLEDAVAVALAPVARGRYFTRRDGAVPPPHTTTWRLLLRDDEALLALPLGATPLHRRPYKQASVPGTLHPPLAAAMALLANLRPTDRVLDPCCGAGTLLIEAARTQPTARCHGLDISPTALTATRANTAHTGTRPPTLTRADAARLPLATGTVDAILVNPPWSRQVPAAGLLADDPTRLWAEVRRVASSSACLVCLLEIPAAEHRLPGWLVSTTRPISLMGRYIQIVAARPY